jgi:hypothetical protein
LCAVSLAVPRAVVPDEIPLPSVDRAEVRRSAEHDRVLVAGAVEKPLPMKIRAVGEAFRRFGLVETHGDIARADEASRTLRARVSEGRAAFGDDPLLALRAVQADLFVRAVRRWETTGVEEPDVTELGGGFLRRAASNGWVSHDHTLEIGADGLAAIFAMRWTKLCGLIEKHPFSPTLNQWRLYFRTLMAHPESSNDTGVESQILASYVTAIARKDPDYPELLARGILAFRMNDYPASEAALVAHLRRHPDGPWWLRARNYLVAARERLPAEE